MRLQIVSRNPIPLAQKGLLFAPPEFAICLHVGLTAKRTELHNGARRRERRLETALWTDT
jgi:hypothetical protein